MGNQIYFKIAGKKKMDRRVEPPDTFLEENHPMTISSKFCSDKKTFLGISHRVLGVIALFSSKCSQF
jgi:hypothetical protein